jgi:hypothetical protein
MAAHSKGSCVCGAIAFEIDVGAIVVSIGCYCVNCRKVSGSQYGVYLQVRRDGFRWVRGEDHAVSYESSPGNDRAFCRTCGSVAPVPTSYGAVRVPGGALDDDPGVVPDVILFARSKAGWCADDAASRAFIDAGPQEFWIDVVRRLTAS